MRTVIPDDSYGFLCKRGDAYDMANKIKLLMSNDSIKKDITERTRKRMELFTKEAVGKQIYTAVMEIEKSN